MRFEIAEMALFFIAFLGLILAFVCSFVSKIKKELKISLSSLLIITSCIVFIGTLNYSGKTKYLIHLFRTDSPLHYLIGPSFYFYTVTIVRATFKFRKAHLLHLLPFIVNVFLFLPFFLSSTENKLLNYAFFMEKGTIIIPMQYMMKTISAFVYFILQLYLLKKYIPLGYFKLKTNHNLGYWFIIYFSAQFILIGGVSLDQLVGLGLINDPYRFAISMIALFLLTVMLGLLFFPVLLYGTINPTKEVKVKYSHSKLSEEEKKQLLSKLYAYMTAEEKPFLNSKLTLNDVSELLATHNQLLSQVINEKTGSNFNDFINAYRVEEAINILTSSSLTKLTIEAIALKAGFNSKSAFYTAFKKQTGKTPKEFLASLQK